MPGQDEMDAIVDAALDELDDSDDEDEERRSRTSSSVGGNKSAARSTAHDRTAHTDGTTNGEKSQSNGKQKSASTKTERAKDSGSPRAAKDFEAMLRDLLEADNDDDDDDDDNELVQDFMKGVEQKLKGKVPTNDEPNDTNIERTISSLVEEMAKHSGIGAANRPPDLPDLPDENANEEEMLKEMMEQFQKSIMDGVDGGGLDTDAVIDGMMEQIMSKDLMYEPMKKVTEQFPDWLKENKNSLSEKEYDERNEQFKCFQELVRVYESDPENTMKLIELMQQVQEYGQPPQEIVNDIAPGLDLDEDGMPKLSPFGDLPFGNDEDGCIIM